ncbi:MAG: hypothetical protein COB02_13840 [Candidatus Cloacimonadota bacterium]|nr:MAG: hypothetical protein COB02_13840 [Candidatus Cloacimonadota bacterium]
MSKIEKLLKKMRSNPKDWKIEQIETLANRFGIQVRKTGGSHFVFYHELSNIAVTIPFKRPIKSIYINQFLILVDDIKDKL